jgi:hypothetical protein
MRFLRRGKGRIEVSAMQIVKTLEGLMWALCKLENS